MESSSNDNYSRSFLFQYGIPLYHAGIRMTTPINSKLTALLGVVNGWNNVADDNNAKSFFAQANYKPNAKTNIFVSWMGGSEGTGAYLSPKGDGNITTQLFNLVGSYQMTDKFKLGAEGVYATGAGDVRGVHTSGSWDGVALYAKNQFTPTIAAAFRAETFDDYPGAGGVGLRTGFATSTKLSELTFTLEQLAMHGHLVSRLEFRHDFSNQNVFGSASGAGVKDQDTVMLGEVYKF